MLKDGRLGSHYFSFNIKNKILKHRLGLNRCQQVMLLPFDYLLANWHVSTSINKRTASGSIQGYEFLAGFHDPEILNFIDRVLRDG